MKQTFFRLVPIVFLTIAAGRLIPLVNTEWQRVTGAARRLAASLQKRGSPSGVGPAGPVDNTQSTVAFRLMFVVKRSTLSADVEYWNAVRQAIGPRRDDIDWWGVCDSGDACNSLYESAQFSIVGYMASYQMRAVALAHDKGHVLLYEGESLKQTLRQASTPAEMAAEVARASSRPKDGA